MTQDRDKQTKTDIEGCQRTSDQVDADAAMEEHAIDAEDIVDCTVHFGSVSFHMHKYVLVKMSKYFKEAFASLVAESYTGVYKQCTMNQRCTRPGHLCITLSSEAIGGVVIDKKHLKSFFQHMYAHFDGTGDFKMSIETSRDYHTDQMYRYYSQITATDVDKDEVCFQVFECDGVRQFEAIGQKAGDDKDFTKPVGTWFFQTSSASHPHYHLADYFQCDSLIKLYVEQAQKILHTALAQSLYHPVWRLLLLTDQHKWAASLRPECIKMCAKDNHCKKRECFKAVASKLNKDTLIEVFQAAVCRST